MTSAELAIPSTLKSYKKTPIFTQDTTPKGFTKDHSTAEGVWALLHVLSGSLKYSVTENDTEVIYEISPAAPRVIAENQPHSITVEGPVSFQLEFFRESIEKV